VSFKGYFEVTDYLKFQHYKDRNPPWIKFYNTVLDDYELGCLPDASKAHLFAIFLLASRSDNKIPYDAGWVAGKINATDPVDLDLLLEAGYIQRKPAENLEIQGMEQHASKALAELEHDACLETETETETEGESISFDLWWSLVPIKKAKGKARKAFRAALKRTDLQTLTDGIKRYAAEVAGHDPHFIKHPATWLNGDCWDDEASPPRPTDKFTGDGWAQLARGAR